MSIFVIAEAGVNHDGSIETAHRLVDAAVDAGADAVKFQTFKASALLSRGAPKADYQLRSTGRAESQFDMIERLELSLSHHDRLIKYAAEKGIDFLSTPFDLKSLDMLVNNFDLKTIKLGSGEITNGPLLLHAAKTRRNLILSTGMSSIGDIEQALMVLAFGFITDKSEQPSCSAFESAYQSTDGRQALMEKVTLLHCTTEYPAPISDVNLRAIDTLKRVFGLSVGYSDHTEDLHIPIAAVARGATIIEKHFTLDRDLPGPDHKASLEPHELLKMVRAIRDVESALGDGIKRPMKSEIDNRDVARKCLVAEKTITKGELFSIENIACKRPSTGLSPMKYWEVLGKIATKNYVPDDPIDI
ncbi:MAG: N-acetylneuraminate synthase [Burkholderiales bacterium]|nr:N-acetylneuraminate synthase [Burkholderiales bacterium]